MKKYISLFAVKLSVLSHSLARILNCSSLDVFMKDFNDLLQDLMMRCFKRGVI